MDGVLTRTASVHAAAWKQAFDEFLADHVGPGFQPFDAEADYDRYVDGRARSDGARSFLESRGIRLPDGLPGDHPGAMTIAGVSNRKNELVLAKIRESGVAVFDDAVRYAEAVAGAGYARAVVSASANTVQVLEAAGLLDLFPVRVDGIVAEVQHLASKPAPDMFLAGARLLGLDAARSAVFEDALAGVEAGRAGGFGCVVGVDRVGQAEALRQHGADIVVSDLTRLLADSPGTAP